MEFFYQYYKKNIFNNNNVICNRLKGDALLYVKEKNTKKYFFTSFN